MAKQSFDDDVLTPIDAPIDPLDDLTPSERENMTGAVLRISQRAAELFH